MIERLTEIVRSRWGVAAISLAAFTLAHLGYWGWAHLMIAGFAGIVLTGLYSWRRDLAANMIALYLRMQSDFSSDNSRNLQSLHARQSEFASAVLNEREIAISIRRTSAERQRSVNELFWRCW